jgi:hypothetical protein
MQNSKKIPIPIPILYVCNPTTYVGGTDYDLRQAKLSCTKCSTDANITSENLKTTCYQADSVEKITFAHSPIYGGQCLRTDCRRLSDTEIWNIWKTMCSKKQ